MADWITFWNSEHAIYVNARHRDAHYRKIADDVAAYIPSPGATVVDYGCGEALHADRVAAGAAKLILCEAAPLVRGTLTRRFGQNRKIEVRSPDEVAALPDQSADLIVLHSVAQYMTPAEADALFARFRKLLKPGGLFVLGDVIPSAIPAVTDALALLRFGLANGFFFAAVSGLIRTALSDYWRLRQALGLTRYDEEPMRAKLAAAGFEAKRAPNNIGHNPARMTFLARPV
jgi:SAM-dependent methyltransferase